MLKKYKNGFFFDTEMKTKTGEIIDYETQLKRYKIGTKANWRNPNSTDVKTINENDNQHTAHRAQKAGDLQNRAPA